MQTNDLDIKSGVDVINAEAAALKQLAEELDHNFTDAVELLVGIKGRTVVSGMGKSGHIARKVAATMASTGSPAHFVHPGNAAMAISV